MKLPKKGEIVSVETVISICREYGMMDIVSILINDPPKNQFISDGCSMWPDIWGEFDLYEDCLKHDIRYWCGMPRDQVGRLLADLYLTIDVLIRTKNPELAMTMFRGVRLGGGEKWNLQYSWGFGRK